MSSFVTMVSIRHSLREEFPEGRLNGASCETQGINSRQRRLHDQNDRSRQEGKTQEESSHKFEATYLYLFAEHLPTKQERMTLRLYSIATVLFMVVGCAFSRPVSESLSQNSDTDAFDLQEADLRARLPGKAGILLQHANFGETDDLGPNEKAQADPNGGPASLTASPPRKQPDGAEASAPLTDTDLRTENDSASSPRTQDGVKVSAPLTDFRTENGSSETYDALDLISTIVQKRGDDTAGQRQYVHAKRAQGSVRKEV
ncbi:SWI/SNF and RSC complex subunit Ssr2 [Branchiostoma belcheri]|nr:SWI/SNF and RSC complex subunit Ssr2 [Branchiostoma belcheri]